MALKLRTSPITEELGHLFSLWIYSCKWVATMLEHWSLLAQKVGAAKHFGFFLQRGAAFGLCFCVVPPFTPSSLLSWFNVCSRGFDLCPKAVLYLLATLLWTIWTGKKKKKSTRKVKLIRTIATWTCLFCPVKVLVLSRTAKEVERDALAGWKQKICFWMLYVLLSENPQTCQVIKSHLAGGCRWVVTFLLHCLLLRVLQLISI